MDRFKSNGKLMLTGEYLALKGAQTIALPLSYGQTLLSVANSSDIIQWKSKDKDGNVWFKGKYNIVENFWVESTSGETAEWLSKIFLAILKDKNQVLFKQGYNIETQLQFDQKWGWGSSSTLIDLVAQWSKTDPFYLASESFGGSMYDIACAHSKGPIQYQLNQGQPIYNRIEFSPTFKKQLHFIYLGKKQNSRKAIEGFDKKNSYEKEIITINSINAKILECNDLKHFSSLIKQHEQVIGKILNQAPVQERLFPDFDGQIKSLGAWGGDFILSASPMNRDQVKKYFQSRKLMTILEFDEIIL